MGKYMGEAGAQALWNKSKTSFGASLKAEGAKVTLLNKAATPAELASATIGNATQAAAGAMSADDKKKLDGIATGATKVTVDSSLSDTSANPVQNKAVNAALGGKAATIHKHVKSDITNFPASLPNPSKLKITTWTGDSDVIITEYDGTYQELLRFSGDGINIESTTSGIAEISPDYTMVASTTSPAFKGTPTAPTAAAGTNTTQVATTAFVQTAVAGALTGSALYKGTLNSASDLTSLTSYMAGWYWVVGTAGTYAGEECEAGDMVFCNADKSGAYKEADFDVVQANIVELTAAEVEAICV